VNRVFLEPKSKQLITRMRKVSHRFNEQIHVIDDFDSVCRRQAAQQALAGVKPTGSVTLGNGKPTPTRLTLERTTDEGRLLTIVSDRPLLFIGAGMPEAKPKEGYDFGVIDIVVDEKGAGKGTMSPAAKVTLKDGAFVVDDYAKTNPVQLASVTKVK